jgi:hypothetical protein
MEENHPLQGAGCLVVVSSEIHLNYGGVVSRTSPIEIVIYWPKKPKKAAMAQGPTFCPLPTSTGMPDNVGAQNVFKETSKR